MTDRFEKAMLMPLGRAAAAAALIGALFASFPAATQTAPAGLPPFHIAVDDAPVGPLTEAQLREHARNGTLDAETLVWTAGMADWSPAGSVETLAAILAAPDGTAAGPDGEGFLLGDWISTDIYVSPNWGPTQADLTKVYSPDGTFMSEGTMTFLEPPWPGFEGRPLVLEVERGGEWTFVSADAENIRVRVDERSVSSNDEMEMYLTDERTHTYTMVLRGPDAFHDGEVEWVRVTR